MTCSRLRAALGAACFAALAASALGASAARAQGGRVVVETSPALPVAGLPAEVSVRFLETRPERVSVFLRPTGTLAYTELPGAQVSPGVFRAQLDEVPPQGVEAFAQFVLGGVTLTEPRLNPEDNPFRVPAFVPRAESAQRLPARQYRMISVPLLLASSPEADGVSGLGSDDPDDVLGDDFGPGANPAQWRLLRFDQDFNDSRDYAEDEGFGPILAGRGYWLITAAGGPFDVEDGLSAGVVFDGRPFPAEVVVPLQPGWNQIGNPFLFPIAWDDVGQRVTGSLARGGVAVEDPVAFRGAYEPAQATLEPWEGYFVFNNTDAEVQLLFSATPPPDGDEVAATPAARLLRRAGPGGYLVEVRAGAGEAADRVYLGTYGPDAAEAHRLTLRKPPAVDGGLRVTALADGAARASSFRAAGGAQAWEVAVETAAPGARVTLHLGEHGARPDGLALAVDDLDRGAALAVQGGRVDVPAVAGLAVRRLRVRLDAADGSGEAGPPAALGRPAPNPTTGAVAVAVRMAAAGPARLSVVDVLGRRVRVLHDGPLAAGPHEVRWDGRDALGRPVAAGVFVLRLDAAGASASARVTVVP